MPEITNEPCTCRGTNAVAPYQMAVEAKSYRPKVRATDRCCKEQAWDPDREQQ